MSTSKNKWIINKQNRNPNRVAYQAELGESLRGIAVGLRTLAGGLNQNLRLASTTISTPVHKILMGSRPLIHCVHPTRLPPLVPSDMLHGQSPELFPPLSLTIGPPEKGPGTGLMTICLAWILPLYGLEYRAEQRMFAPRPLWDHNSPGLSIDDWLKQELVELSNGDLQTISEIVGDIRNKRGSHTDATWIADFPQPLRQFYTQYADFFMVQVGMLLLDTAIASLDDDDFRQCIFPGIDDPGRELRYPPMPGGKITTPHTKLGDDPGTRFSFELDKARTLWSIPDRGAGTTGMNVVLLAMGAPGWATRPIPQRSPTGRVSDNIPQGQAD